RRAVEQRPARLVLATEDLEQPALEQDLERRRGVDAADLLELGPRERLTVRRDGQGLELGAAQPYGLALHDLAHERRVRGGRAELIAAGELHQPEPAPRAPRRGPVPEQLAERP